MRTARPLATPAIPTPAHDLIALGATPRRIHTAVANGRLMRVRRGVYLDPARWPDGDEERHLVRAHAEQVYREESAVSHRSAALYWQLPLLYTDWAVEPVWITQPIGRGFRTKRTPSLEQRVASLPSHHTARTPSGCLVTTRARTAADLVAHLELPEALTILDAALRSEATDLLANARRRDLRNPVLVAAARRPLDEAMTRWGMGTAREWLGYANPLRESVIESLSFAHMVLAGLPLPECQYALKTRRGTVYPDFYWPRYRLIGEADGRVKYADAEAIVKEKEREQDLRDLDYRIVRWLGKEIHLRPADVMDRIARAMAA